MNIFLLFISLFLRAILWKSGVETQCKGVMQGLQRGQGVTEVTGCVRQRHILNYIRGRLRTVNRVWCNECSGFCQGENRPQTWLSSPALITSRCLYSKSCRAKEETGVGRVFHCKSGFFVELRHELFCSLCCLSFWWVLLSVSFQRDSDLLFAATPQIPLSMRADGARRLINKPENASKHPTCWKELTGFVKTLLLSEPRHMLGST